jgi:hypothetical protein
MSKNGSKETVPNDWQPWRGARDASWSYRRAFFRITLCDDVDSQIAVSGDIGHGELTSR